MLTQHMTLSTIGPSFYHGHYKQLPKSSLYFFYAIARNFALIFKKISTNYSITKWSKYYR